EPASTETPAPGSRTAPAPRQSLLWRVSGRLSFQPPNPTNFLTLSSQASTFLYFISGNRQHLLRRKVDTHVLSAIILAGNAPHENLDIANLHDIFGGLTEKRDLKDTTAKSINGGVPGPSSGRQDNVLGTDQCRRRRRTSGII